MPRIPNNQARKYVESHTEFKGSNTRGSWEIDLNSAPQRPFYVVYSYGTPIMAYDLVSNTWFFNPKKYSRTTSKQFSQLCPTTASKVGPWQDYLDMREGRVAKPEETPYIPVKPINLDSLYA